ncbi:MAG: DNA-processing protein DprA [Acidobacteria bacterium]|nr:DNA-processing protein DprA [Acidobacteriota bacterium]
MSESLSANTKAILLLTAPLIVGRRAPGDRSVKPLSLNREYNLLAKRLREIERAPADLLGADAGSVLSECLGAADPAVESLDPGRIEALLGRGMQLSLAVENWQARAIWVLSRADDGYPSRLKRRLGSGAPAVLYGCGERSFLDCGGLAVVGPRAAAKDLLAYARDVGELAAEAGRTVVSGGARGVDRAAMSGALAAGGRASGVLASDLARAATHRDNRDALLDGRLILVSAYDPAARFLPGHAMERNHSVYGLADAALVVDALTDGGGTRAGAVAHLGDSKRSTACPVYVRSTLGASEGLAALETLGAIPWLNPKNPDELAEVLEQRGVKAATTGGREAQVSATEAPSRIETARQQLMLPVGKPP